MKDQDKIGRATLPAALVALALVAGCDDQSEAPQESPELQANAGVEQTSNPEREGLQILRADVPPEFGRGEPVSIESIVEVALAQAESDGMTSQPPGSTGYVVEPPGGPMGLLAFEEWGIEDFPNFGPPGSDNPAGLIRVASASWPNQPPPSIQQSPGVAGNGSLPADRPARRAESLSDEQDFEAVSVRETIESDAVRRQGQQQQLIVFRPSDLPERTGASNVAAFALSVSHEAGTAVYPRRVALFSSRSYEDRCRMYPDEDAAQLAFLDSGGPSADRLGIDPDGDGYACSWNPAIYRKML